MKNSTIERRDIPKNCPHCGEELLYLTGDKVYGKKYAHLFLYACSDFPHCHTFVGTHKGSMIPLGVPANKRLRKRRVVTHELFDRLWKGRKNSRKLRTRAYLWLQKFLDVDKEHAHIAMLDMGQCNKVISFLKGKDRGSKTWK